MKIIAGTGNQHKLVEFAEILAPLGFEIFPADMLSKFPEIEENGQSFEENASIKAFETAKFAKEHLPDEDFLSMADDSGLEIFALGGRPGIKSARYADTNEARIARVLSEMEGAGDRRARFVCVIALCGIKGGASTFRGEVYGVIAERPSGSAGFGYDPVFVPDGFNESFAELGSEIKNQISHRAKALQLFSAHLRSLRQ